MSEYGWWAAAFFGGFLLIFGLNYVWVDLLEGRRRRRMQRLEEEMRLRRQRRARESLAFQPSSDSAAEGAAELEESPPLAARLLRIVEQSGLHLSLRQLAFVMVAAGLAAGAVGWMLTRSVMGAGLVVPIGCVLPLGYVAVRRSRRMDKFLGQLPDAFDLMGRTMRAGQTMSQALQAVADEFSAPVAEEFGFCYDQQNLGLSAEASLRDLARRTGLLEIKIFVLAVIVHRQTGGNMAELLQKLAHVIRERYRIRGAVQALTAEGRFQAIILLALPPVILTAIALINPDYSSTLFRCPWLLLAMGTSMAFGALWMQRIINFDF